MPMTPEEVDAYVAARRRRDSTQAEHNVNRLQALTLIVNAPTAVPANRVQARKDLTKLIESMGYGVE